MHVIEINIADNQLLLILLLSLNRYLCFAPVAIQYALIEQ